MSIWEIESYLYLYRYTYKTIWGQSEVNEVTGWTGFFPSSVHEVVVASSKSAVPEDKSPQRLLTGALFEQF